MRYVSLALSVFVLVLALIVPAHASYSEDPPVTVYDENGDILYSNEIEPQSEFLYKSFEEYTVTEGFLLLFLILAFCALLFRILRGVI